jgi:hypothetical protein
MLMGRKIGYGNKTIPYISHAVFLGLTVDSTLSWRNYTDLLINKLSTPCCVLHCATSRNVAGSILDGVSGIFH